MSKNPPVVIAQGLFSYQIGGSERVGADLAIEFKRRGYPVICFAFYDTDGPIRAELEREGIPCFDLDYKTRPRYVRRLTYQIEFFRFLKRHNVTALVVHHATALILCGLPARAARVPRVLMIEHGLHQLRDRPDYRRSATRYCRFADIITGVDGTIVDYFRDSMGVPPERLRYIPNGVRLRPRDPRMRAAVRERLKLAADQFAFLFVGRLQPEKDVATLLNSVSLLTAGSKERVRVLIAGDGAERQMLESKCQQMQLTDQVTFLGARRDVPELLAAADAFIMTSITEGQPMALIEAMASELPCIATSVGGIPALLGDGAGLLVRPSAPAEIAGAMERLMTSADLRSDCVLKARQRVMAGHSLDKVTNDYLIALNLASA